MKDEIKVIKLMQQESAKVDSIHTEIGQDLASLKAELLKALGDENSYLEKNTLIEENKIVTPTPLNKRSFSELVEIANEAIPYEVGFRDILSDDDLIEVNNKVNVYIETFNKKHQLDGWDYAIGGGTGFFCGILDVLFIQKPAHPTKTKYSQKVDGLFNQWSQTAINKLIPEDLAKQLERLYKIGGADTSIAKNFTSPIPHFNPINHRFKSLNHDPILAFIIGALDVMNGTCTVVDNGSIKVLETVRGATGDYNFFEALGMMLGHLASDFNTPSAHGNRGMGIPAPLMGLFGTLKDIKINYEDKNGIIKTTDVAKISEWMYTQGYDARHFATMSIPVLINEVLTRVFYVLKEIKYNDKSFFDAFKETLPLNLSPRFRMLLNISYGTMVAVNSGKVAITKNILDANYAMWMAFTWHSFHSMRWLLWTKNTELQKYINGELSKELTELQLQIDDLTKKAELLPIS